jgi:hypothetical protein
MEGAGPSGSIVFRNITTTVPWENAKADVARTAAGRAQKASADQGDFADTTSEEEEEQQPTPSPDRVGQQPV